MVNIRIRYGQKSIASHIPNSQRPPSPSWCLVPGDERGDTAARALIGHSLNGRKRSAACASELKATNQLVILCCQLISEMKRLQGMSTFCKNPKLILITELKSDDVHTGRSIHLPASNGSIAIHLSASNFPHFHTLEVHPAHGIRSGKDGVARGREMGRKSQHWCNSIYYFFFMIPIKC